MKDTQIGGVVLASNVIETVTGIAVQDIPGVYCMGTSVDKFQRFASMFRKYDNPASPSNISVKTDDNSTLNIGVHVTLKYGYNALEVIEDIRKAIKKAVKAQVGIPVNTIDVYIDGVEV